MRQYSESSDCYPRQAKAQPGPTSSRECVSRLASLVSRPSVSTCSATTCLEAAKSSWISPSSSWVLARLAWVSSSSEDSFQPRRKVQQQRRSRHEANGSETLPDSLQTAAAKPSIIEQIKASSSPWCTRPSSRPVRPPAHPRGSSPRRGLRAGSSARPRTP